MENSDAFGTSTWRLDMRLEVLLTKDISDGLRRIVYPFSTVESPHFKKIVKQLRRIILGRTQLVETKMLEYKLLNSLSAANISAIWEFSNWKVEFVNLPLKKNYTNLCSNRREALVTDRIEETRIQDFKNVSIIIVFLNTYSSLARIPKFFLTNYLFLEKWLIIALIWGMGYNFAMLLQMLQVSSATNSNL